MKIYSYINIVCLMLVVAVMVSCEENEVVPDNTKQGEVTVTIASIASSNAKPAASETITVTLKFVNLPEDKVKSVLLKAKAGTADYTPVQTFDEGSAAAGKEIVHEVPYVVTAPKGTVITFDMIVTSQKEYPLTRRTSVTVN
jgi:hypothetical protein